MSKSEIEMFRDLILITRFDVLFDIFVLDFPTSRTTPRWYQTLFKILFSPKHTQTLYKEIRGNEEDRMRETAKG